MNGSAHHANRSDCPILIYIINYLNVPAKKFR